MAQGRKIKICVSLITIGFVLYMIVFSQEIVGKVRKGWHEQQQEEQLKQRLRGRAVVLYNLEHYSHLQNELFSLFTDKSGQDGDSADDMQDIKKLSDLSESLQDSILYMVKSNDNWEIVSGALFKLLDAKDDGQIDGEEFSDFAKYAAENNEHRKNIMKLFDQADFDDDTYITKDEYDQYLTSFRSILIKNLKGVKDDDDSSQRNGGNRLRLLPRAKKSLKNGQQVLDAIEEGLSLHSAHSGDQRIVREERERSVIFFGNSYERWEIVANALFNLADQNKDSQIDQQELRKLAAHFGEAEEDDVFEWLRAEAELIDQSLAQRRADKNFVVHQNEFNTVSQRIYDIFSRYHCDTLESCKQNGSEDAEEAQDQSQLDQDQDQDQNQNQDQDQDQGQDQNQNQQEEDYQEEDQFEQPQENDGDENDDE